MFAGAGARQTLLPGFASYLSRSPLSFPLPFFRGETRKSMRAREWTPWEKFVSVWCCARFTTRESSIVNSRRSVTDHPLTVAEERLSTYGDFTTSGSAAGITRSTRVAGNRPVTSTGHQDVDIDVWIFRILNPSRMQLKILRAFIPRNVEI